MTNRIFLYLLILCVCSSCKEDQPIADMVLINGEIATVDSENPEAEAIAFKEDRIIHIGTTEAIQVFVGEKTKVIDLKGKFAMPGIIEGHGHFSSIGSTLQNLNFIKSKSWDEIVAMVAEKAKTMKPGEWIIGRGWHQEKWEGSLDRQVFGYPYNDKLNQVAPNNPVLLGHASGHGLMANQAAMDLAGVSKETPNPNGGEIVRNSRGEAIGVFEETAMGIINNAYDDYLATLSEEDKARIWYEGIELAEEECIKKGITSFQDAGSTFVEIDRYQKLAEEEELDLRLWAMIGSREENLAENLKRFPILNAGNHFFTSRAIKGYLDGALGSFGAWLLESYNDKPNFHGQNVTPIKEIERIAGLAAENNLQYCVHAIGDRGNREMLDLFEKIFKTMPDESDFRWRIEHSQHIDPADIPRFGELGIIAAMQAIHCTSDAPFVIKRLGEKRAREGAYPWRSLLDAGAIVTNGTDAPVEDVDPLDSFYASVTRKRTDSGMAFFPEQSMTREEALRAYTMSNAYAAFEEQDKGSLEVGKLADVTVLSKNLLTCTDDEILDAEVLYTIIGGKVKFENTNGLEERIGSRE
ncbi:MAG: amidohydrolase [Bacteroidota bacterium]